MDSQETMPRVAPGASEGLRPKVITAGGKIVPVPVLWNGINESGWQPIDDKVLILPDEVFDQTTGGIHLPGDVQEKQQMAVEYGTLIALGPAAYALSGDRVRVWVEVPEDGPANPKPKPGDRVFMERYAGALLTGDDGRTYRLADDKVVGAIRARRG